MAKEHLDSLKALRDHLVQERRDMVESILADPQSSSEVAPEFGGLQQFIDAVEKAMSHEDFLSRPQNYTPPKYSQRPTN